MLQFNDVSYTYPFQDTKALERVSFEVSTGEAVLCTGASGCGKSTLIRLVNGLIPHFFQGDVQGRVILQGKDNNKEHLHEISMKVGSLFQDPEEQFFALTVRDELAFALESRGVSPEEIRRRIWFEAKRFKLDHLMDATVFNLSDGEKQKVALAAILAQKPKMLVLDEPSANLDPNATRELCLILAQLKKQGMTLLIADHRLYWLRDIIDRVFIVEKGRICKTGSFSILEDPSMQSKYGLRNTYVESSTSSFCSVDSASGDGVWLENLSFAYKNQPPIFEDLNTFIPKGKVTAVMGENGSGKTTLARLLTGLLKSGSGNISLNGRPVRAEELLKKGCIILQNTDHQLHMKTVLQELFLSGKHLNKQAREQRTWHLLELFGLEQFSERHPQSLSGGQKQRLVIASGLIKEPEILILDEPTSGLDRRNMDIISRVMQELAGEGASVLVISHDLEFIDKACSHVIRFPFSAKYSNKHFFGGH